MYRYTLCALLAPAVVSAMAFPWAGPEPTFVVPEGDNWSPAPTLAPDAGALELFRRAAGDNTCGYLSGVSTSSLTCNNANYVCATNSAYGVHGCCDPNGLSTCSIKTTCIPSSLMSASCTDAACTSNNYIAKCTNSGAPYCYQWRYVYSTATVMTEFGCASSAFTLSVQRTYSGENSAAASSSQAVIPISYVTVTAGGSSGSASATSSTSSGANNAQPASGTASGSGTSTPSATAAPEKKSHTGAIVGGVVGGLAAVGAIAFGIIFLCLRKRKQKKNAAAAQQPGAPGGAPGVAEYKPQPQGYPPQEGYAPPPQQQPYPPQQGGYYQQDVKHGYAPQMGVAGQEIGSASGQQGPYSPPTSPAPQYSGPQNATAPPAGIAEVGGAPIQHANATPNQHPGHHPQGQNGQPIYEAPA